MSKDKKPLKIFTLDTETRGLFGNVFRIGLYDGEYQKYYVKNKFLDIFPILKFYAKKFDVHVYVHNLDFDLAKIAPELFNNDTIYFSKSVFINGRVAVLATETFTLHDSFMLLPSSLDKLSTDFELTVTHKMDLTEYITRRGWAVYDKYGNYNKTKSLTNFFDKVSASDPVLNEYLKLDCISLYDILAKVIEISELSFYELIYTPTTASLAMKCFKKVFHEDYEKAVSTSWVGATGQYLEMFIRSGYYGGRTEVFTPVLENGFHYDINSLYPAEMMKNKFPIGVPVWYSDSREAKQLYDIIKQTKEGGGFLYCRIYIPESMYIPPLPYKDVKGKLLFPVGNLEGVWTIPELEIAEKMGCEIVEYKELVYFSKMDYIFKDFVSHFAKIKMNSKGAKKQFAKLMQNSLYGKFGMKRVRPTLCDIDDTEKYLDKDYHVISYTQNLMNVRAVEYNTISYAKYIQPQIAAYVTAYGRITLLKGILRQLREGKVNYCDTDSIACESRMDDKKTDDKEYGKWKLEGIVEKGIYLQPKFYAEKATDTKGTKADVIKSKGIPREILDTITFSDFEKWLDIIITGKDAKIDIFKDLPARKKFLTMLKDNQHMNTKVSLSKSINLTLEQKRKMDYANNSTAPRVIHDFGTLADVEKIMEFKVMVPFDDVNILEKDIEHHGKIKTIPPDEPLFPLYHSLGEKARLKFFDDNGVDIMKWCAVTGWCYSDLLTEMKYIF